MKTLLAVAVAAAIGFAGAYYWVTSGALQRQQQERAAAEAAWLAEKESLEKALAQARSAPPEIRRITTTEKVVVTNASTPQEIIARLISLRPGGGEEARNRIIRQIVHQFQQLAEMGAPALPAIKEFLAANQDVDYTAEELNEAGERSTRSDRWNSRHAGRTDFLVPPSLRLGLVDVLDQIGGEAAEQIMAEVLSTTGRGVEVAYLSRLLQENNPDKYREMALQAAKELLSNPPSIDQPNRLDDNAKAYLYQVLTMYKDTSFAQTAEGLLVSPDGHVDRSALNYLNATFKEQALPAIHEAYKNPRLTNQFERANLLNVALSYAGQNPHANQMFEELINNESMPSGMRAFTVQSLAGGWRGETPSDPAVVQARVTFLEEMRNKTKDERILRAINETAANLQRILSGEVPPSLTAPVKPGAAADPQP